MSHVAGGWLVPGMPHPLMCPERNAGWNKIRQAFDQARKEIEQSDADLLVIYSTFWPSIIGHQIQALAEPKWTHVDEEWHELGSIDYEFKIDAHFAESIRAACQKRGLHARTVAYQGFPIDTGSIVALKLLNPDNKIPAVILSSNVYSDRAETIVFGKACHDAVKEEGRKAVGIAVSALSNRLFTEIVADDQDHIHSLKDDEWNQKYLEFLNLGRLEDVSQLSRQFHREARVHKVSNFKPFWWLSAFMGQHNRYQGKTLAYEPIYGTGAAVVGLWPAESAARDLEYDENDPEQYEGDRNVLSSSQQNSDFGGPDVADGYPNGKDGI